MSILKGKTEKNNYNQFSPSGKKKTIYIYIWPSDKYSCVIFWKISNVSLMQITKVVPKMLSQCVYSMCGVKTLQWQSVHSVPCLTQEEPLKRMMLCSSSQVLVMSLRIFWARQGSVTQRGQHSPSGTIVKSQCAGGHSNGQQSTSPCCSTHNIPLSRLTYYHINIDCSHYAICRINNTCRILDNKGFVFKSIYAFFVHVYLSLQNILQ